MPTKWLDEKAVTAFTKLFLGDKPLSCETAQMKRSDGGVAQCAVEVVVEGGSYAHTMGEGAVCARLGLTEWASRKLREELG